MITSCPNSDNIILNTQLRRTCGTTVVDGYESNALSFGRPVSKIHWRGDDGRSSRILFCIVYFYCLIGISTYLIFTANVLFFYCFLL